MRIGYPCINRSIGCTPSRTFRLASYTEERLRDTIRANLACLGRILQYNYLHGLLFLRITSDLVPFASHPVCRFGWQEYFLDTFRELGQYCRDRSFRISMHPDQFVLLNSPNETVRERSLRELEYQVDILNLMGLDRTAKVQIHIGGLYGDRDASIRRFSDEYAQLPKPVSDRLVIENDERLFSLADCLTVHTLTGIPVIFDAFHHEIFNNGEKISDAMHAVAPTWARHDGIPMVDYSSQQEGKRRGAHAKTINPTRFSSFLAESAPCDFDLMLEIKDKEKSARAALALAAADPRLVTRQA